MLLVISLFILVVFLRWNSHGSKNVKPLNQYIKNILFYIFEKIKCLYWLKVYRFVQYWYVYSNDLDIENWPKVNRFISKVLEFQLYRQFGLLDPTKKYLF